MNLATLEIDHIGNFKIWFYLKAHTWHFTGFNERNNVIWRSSLYKEKAISSKKEINKNIVSNRSITFKPILIFENRTIRPS